MTKVRGLDLLMYVIVCPPCSSCDSATECEVNQRSMKISVKQFMIHNGLLAVGTRQHKILDRRSLTDIATLFSLKLLIATLPTFIHRFNNVIHQAETLSQRADVKCFCSHSCVKKHPRMCSPLSFPRSWLNAVACADMLGLQYVM